MKLQTYHYAIDLGNGWEAPACSLYGRRFWNITSSSERVTCKRCKRTKAFKEAQPPLVQLAMALGEPNSKEFE